MRRYNGKTLKYETLCSYKDFFGDIQSEYKEDWELEAERYGAILINHDHNLRFKNGDVIENDEKDWNEYLRSEEIRDRMFNGAS